MIIENKEECKRDEDDHKVADAEENQKIQYLILIIYKL